MGRERSSRATAPICLLSCLVLYPLIVADERNALDRKHQVCFSSLREYAAPRYDQHGTTCSPYAKTFLGAPPVLISSKTRGSSRVPAHGLHGSQPLLCVSEKLTRANSPR